MGCFMEEKFVDVIKRFKIEGDVVDIKPFGNGHINKTYLLTTTKNKYMFQVINSFAFHNIDDLMRNIYIVTTFLKENGFYSLEVIKTINNKLYISENDFYYRIYKYVDKSLCYEGLDSPELIEATGQSFGRLHNGLSGLDSVLIAETIPHFHDTPKRYFDLIDSTKTAPKSRLINAEEEIDFVIDSRKSISVIMDGLNDGSIPERVVHNDPKINNILFDEDTKNIKCVIDLDTVMPGSCLFDFGDGLRSLFTGDNESNRDTSLLKVNFEAYELYTKGYLSEMKSSLTQREKELLPYSIYVIAMELGMRFLEDYLREDKYFAISFGDENLVRAKGQFALAKDILLHLDQLKEITNKYI